MVYFQFRGARLIQISYSHLQRIIELLYLILRLESRFLNFQLRINSRDYNGLVLLKVGYAQWIKKETPPFFLYSLKDSHNIQTLSLLHHNLPRQLQLMHQHGCNQDVELDLVLEISLYLFQVLQMESSRYITRRFNPV